MYQLRNKLNKAMMRAHVAIICSTYGFRDRIKSKMTEKNGNVTEHTTIIVIGVVLAGILLVGIVALLKNKVMPGLDSKVDDFFATT